MDCRRRLRLGSGAALVVAATVLCESTLRSGAVSDPQQVFESHPQVAALQCPSSQNVNTHLRQGYGGQAGGAPSPSDRIPDADELESGAIAVARPSAARPAPPLPPDVVRGFALPSGDGRPLRVGVWGDSHVAAGFITDELMKYVEAGGLEVETRAIPASLGRPGVRLPLRRVCKGDGWQFQAGYSAPATMRLGPSLANLRSSRVGDYLWIDLRHRPDREVRGIRIHYLPTRSRSTIGIRIDEGSEVRFELTQSRDQENVSPGVIDLRASSSISTLKLRVLQGDLVLHGFTLDYSEPAPIAIDVFGIPSATAKGWANADLAYLKTAMQPEGYDAIILEYGTNEGAVGRFDASKYAAMLAASLRSVRQVFPNSACLLIGPTDRGVRIPARRSPSTSLGASGRDLLHYSRIHQQITGIQTDVGASVGCAMWDWQRYMGGAGSIYLWARETPALAAADLIHLTPPGYRRTAAALAQSIGWRLPKP